MKDANLSFAAIAGVIKPYCYHMCRKIEGKAVKFLTERDDISSLHLCLWGDVLHVWEMTEL